MKLTGETLIQLFKDGKEVQRVQHKNRFTGALDSLFNGIPLGLQSSWHNKTTGWNRTTDNIAASVNQTPVVENALGGILLFPNTINAEETLPDPMYDFTQEPTAIACQEAYTGEDVRRGNFNANESGEVTGGYKFVYDWGTSQGNGTISCVSLTHNKGGMTYLDTRGAYYGGYHFLYAEDYGSQSYGYAVLVTDHVYTIADKSILKMPIKTRAIDLLTNQYGTLEDAENIYTFTDSHSLDFFAYGTKIYALYTAGNTSGNASITVYSYDVDTGEEATNNYTISATLAASGGYLIAFDGDNNILYLRGRSNNLFAVNMSNLADVNEIAIGTSVNQSYAYTGDFISSNSFAYYPRMNGGTVKNGLSDTNLLDIGREGVWLIQRQSRREGGGTHTLVGTTFLTPYLATINNLETPVVKTADKTMKVTYTVYQG